jgi:hypothetical protein
MDKDNDPFVITAGDNMSSPVISALDIEQIKPLDIGDLNLDTISIDTTLNNYGTNLSGSGQYAAAGNYVLSTNGTNPAWSSLNWPSITSGGSTIDKSLSVKGDAEFEGDVKIKGHSILHLLKKIEDRLAVLQEPDPEKLEKFAALKKAYDHYKTLEKLIGDE